MTINESLGVIKEMLDKKCLTGYWKGKWYITEERKEALQTLISAVENRPSVEDLEKFIIKFIAEKGMYRDFKSRIVGRDELEELAKAIAERWGK